MTRYEPRNGHYLEGWPSAGPEGIRRTKGSGWQMPSPRGHAESYILHWKGGRVPVLRESEVQKEVDGKCHHREATLRVTFYIGRVAECRSRGNPKDKRKWMAN